MSASHDVCVVGAGVVGLSTALVLAQRGRSVKILAGNTLDQTTSSVAAAYWAPYWVGTYQRHWASTSLAHLQQLAAEGKSSVRVTRFEEWLTDTGAEELRHEIDTAYWWRDLPGINFRWQTDGVSMETHATDGKKETFSQRVEFESPVARMSDYMMSMQRQLQNEFDVTIEQQWLSSLDELAGSFKVVVNCTGWGAKTLVTDDVETERMRLLAGHVVRLKGSNRTSAVSLHRGEYRAAPMYLVPRVGSERDMICGGTAIEIDTTLDPREPVTCGMPEQCEEVWRRCVAFDPSLAELTEREFLVGLRPVRSAVRVEQDASREWLFHNYGHGGAGLTLAWGTAEAICDLIERG